MGENPSRLGDESAIRYLETVIKLSLETLLSDSLTIRKYLDLDVDVSNAFAYLSDVQIDYASSGIGECIHDRMIIEASRDPNLYKGIELSGINFSKSRLQTYIASYLTRVRDNAGSISKSDVPEELRGISTRVAYAASCDLIKALPEQDIENYVPRKTSDVALFLSRGIVPEGYLSRDQVATVSQRFADEMRWKSLPLVKAAYFDSVMSRRAMESLERSAESMALAIEDDPDVLESLLEKAQTEGFDLLKTYTEVARIHGEMFGRGESEWSIEQYRAQCADLSKALGCDALLSGHELLCRVRVNKSDVE